MELLLFDNNGFTAERFTAGDTLLKVVLNGQYHSRCLKEGNPQHEEFRQKVISASNIYCQKTGRSLCIHIKKNPTDFSNSEKCLVRIHGFLLRNPDFVLEQEDIKIRIQLCFTAYTENVALPHNTRQLLAEIPASDLIIAKVENIDKLNEECLKLDESFLEMKDVTFYHSILFDSRFGNHPLIYGRATVSLVTPFNTRITSESDKMVMFDNVNITLTRLNRKILESRIHSDVVIVASDGSEFECHKSFLTAHSSVLAAMLDADMKESKTNRIEFQDMSSDGVEAFLEYIYTYDLEEAIERSDIALELLQAGHKYDMKPLEIQVSSILINRGTEWLNVDTAFRLFLFTKKVDSMKDVKMKAASVLIMKPKEFMECEAYKRELQESPKEAANAVQELFCLIASIQ